ncbi:hypothetical protein JYT44_00925 [Caldithrix abyssi]|nr:hypothetical protein [Caldithrix abyssi]
MKNILFIGLILLVACSQKDDSSSVQMTVELDTTYTTIGSPVIYSVTIQSPKDKIIQFPEWVLEDPLEVRSSDFSAIGLNQVGRFELVFWDTGQVAIPGPAIQVLNADSTLAYEMSADSMFMEVVSITDQDPSLKQSGGGIMPIKDPVPVQHPLPWRTIILAMILVGIVVGIVWIWKKRLEADISYEVKLALLKEPDTVALKKLAELDQSRLLTEGNVKEFYAQLSLILREYTESSLFIRTLEMTTEEIRQHRPLFPYTQSQLDEYLNILSGSDMAKYAKHIASLDQCASDLAVCRSFIQDTVQFWKIPSNS